MTATFDGPAYRPGDEAFEAEIETDNRSPTRMRTAAPILLDTVRAMPYADIATVHNDPTGPYQVFESGRFHARARRGSARPSNPGRTRNCSA